MAKALKEWHLFFYTTDSSRQCIFAYAAQNKKPIDLEDYCVKTHPQPWTMRTLTKHRSLRSHGLITPTLNILICRLRISFCKFQRRLLICVIDRVLWVLSAASLGMSHGIIALRLRQTEIREAYCCHTGRHSVKELTQIRRADRSQSPKIHTIKLKELKTRPGTLQLCFPQSLQLKPAGYIPLALN